MLLGRAPELAALAGRLVERKPLCLLGEAGVGKTSLLRAAAAASGRKVYEGGGLSSLAYLSYLPLVRALREEPPAGDHAAVAAWAAEHVDGGVVVLDDLHWADPETLSLLPLLAPTIGLAVAIRSGDPGAARAQASAEAAGLEIFALDGLTDQDAEALVRARRPELDNAEITAIVAAAGGNPLLLEELAAGNGLETLRLGLGARLHRCSATGQEAMALLGLLARPAEPGLITDGVPELLEAGLVRETDGFAPRHALLGEAAIARLSEGERRELHARLARNLPDSGEAARHHQAAGENEAAHRKALDAAECSTRPGERARHLGVAALCASGPGADELRIQAAHALVDVGDSDAVEQLAAAVENTDPAARAEVHLCRARMHVAAGDPKQAEPEIESGLELVGGTGSPTEVRLRIERVRVPLWAWDGARAIELSAEALALARATGVHEALALTLAGTAHYDVFSPASRTYHEEALRAARQEGDSRVELEAAAHLLLDLSVIDGDGKSAYALSEEMAARARSLGLRCRELEFRMHLARLRFYVWGDASEAIKALSVLMDEPALGVAQDQAGFDLVYPLAWTGRVSEARAVVEKALSNVHTDYGRAALECARAEVEWHAGRAAKALDLAEHVLATSAVGGLNYEVAETRSWAALDLGRRPRAIELERVSGALCECALDEVDALHALLHGRSVEAEHLLDEVATRWAPFVLCNELRCLWAAGEAARRAGALDRARERLLAVEERTEQYGFAPLLGRIRKSLRQAGVPRSVPRSQPAGGLTDREREVLALVGEGLSNEEAARRLGVSGTTIDAQLKSARRKLGARTRAQAAALARTVD
jgi:DNA-binding CsgD family transcriptional regulator